MMSRWINICVVWEVGEEGKRGGGGQNVFSVKQP